jgi:HD-GYP domain-containing protein (c-di-GMP phosphodiesterase class II)
MEQLLVHSLAPGKYFNKRVYLDDRYILLSPETPFNEQLKNRMIEWGFDYVQTDGQQVDSSDAAPGAEAAEDAPLISVEEGEREKEHLEEVQSAYADALNFTEKLFTDFVTKSELSQRAVTDKVKEINDFVRSRRQHALRIKQLKNEDKNYVVEHSVKTTMLSLAIGNTVKLPHHKLIELGTGSLLHEIGMIRLPPQLYMTDKKLSDQERKAITAHTLLGFKILKQYSYPLSVCLAVLECREYLNGTGYPRGLTGEKMSFYARVISVTSSFAALVSDRPFRPARDEHASMLELLKGRDTLYDGTVLKALVANLSIYPLGSYVELANGYRGVVVDTSDDGPRSPIVRLMVSPNGERYVDQPHVRTVEEDYRVARSLDEDEIKDVKNA